MITEPCLYLTRLSISLRLLPQELQLMGASLSCFSVDVSGQEFVLSEFHVGIVSAQDFRLVDNVIFRRRAVEQSTAADTDFLVEPLTQMVETIGRVFEMAGEEMDVVPASIQKTFAHVSQDVCLEVVHRCTIHQPPNVVP